MLDGAGASRPTKRKRSWPGSAGLPPPLSGGGKNRKFAITILRGLDVSLKLYFLRSGETVYSEIGACWR